MMRASLLGFLFALSQILVPVADGQITSADSALWSGHYDDAETQYSRALRSDRSSVDAARGLVAALVAVGKYSEAEQVARDFRSNNRNSVELSNRLGEILYRTGRLRDARREFERALSGEASDSARTRLNLAMLRFAAGDVTGAEVLFDSFVTLYNGSRNLNSEEVATVGTAVRYLARNSSRLFNAAVRAYGEAIRLDQTNHRARVLLGDLLLEKLNGTEAYRTFQEVLAVNPDQPEALLGAARWARFDGSANPMEFVEHALEVNPNMVDAHAFRGLLLLESERYDSAAAEAERGLSVDATSLPAMSVLAAARFLQGREQDFEANRRRAVERSPGSPDLYNLLAEVSARNRLYREAADFAARAVAIDSLSWRGFGLLGMNQLRLGLIEEGRANLEKSFAGDPFNVWNKNTLDLVDTFENYSTTTSDRFEVAIERAESDLLALYVVPLAEEAFDSLTLRYGYTPPDPVRVEVMPTHDDFSVRTVGLPGIGALGVSFGPVVAMDSPSARNRGDFNWGSTLWHELVHTVTLGLTANRAPRWFAEGLAVYEERRARVGWGAGATLSFLLAYRQGKTPSFEHLNQTFVRPTYPEQVVHSYYQASVILQAVNDRFGWSAVIDLMRAYGSGSTTDEAFRDVLGLESDDVDELFDRYMRTNYGAVLGVLPDDEIDPNRGPPRSSYLGKLAQAIGLVEGNNFDAAIPILEELKGLYPQYAGGDSPYLALARIYRSRGDLRRAATELRSYTDVNERGYDANVALATTLIQLSDTAGAAAALDRAMFIYPYQIDNHRDLAAYYESLGNLPLAVRERRAVVALQPADMVAAHYELARDLKRAGELREARRSVLDALELAPNYEEAQNLLMEIRAERNRE